MFYGDKTTKTKKNNVFYTGLNIRLLFNSYTPSFLCPFSTTIDIEIALRFSDGKGIILQLKQDSNCEISKYFDVEWLSTFPEERERLFVFTYGLQIQDIKYMEPGLSCNNVLSIATFVSAFNFFKSMCWILF